MVETALQESRINANHRLHTVPGQAGRHIDGGTFGNPHVIETVGELLAEFHQPRAVTHRRGDCDNLLVALGQLRQMFAEGARKAPPARHRSRFDRVSVYFERTGRMKFTGALIRRTKTFALLRVNVQDRRVIQLAQRLEQFYE